MRRIQKILQDYVAGDLDPEARASIERRIAGEPRVRALHRKIARAHEALGSLRDRPEPPVSADEALPFIQAAISSRQFEARPQLSLEGPGSRYYRRIALAATVLFAVSVGLLAFREGESRALPGEQPAQPPAAERLLTPVHLASPNDLLFDATGRGGVDGATLLEILEKAGKRAADVRVTPNYGVLPVTEGATQRR